MDYLFHIVTMVALFSILATSFNLLVGFAGLFALSHAAFYAIGAYTTAILSTSHGIAFPWPIAAGVILTALVGAAIAIPALRIAGDYLVIVSLALQVIVLAIIVNAKELTGGPMGIIGIPRIEIAGLRLDTPARFTPFAASVAAVAFWIAWRIGASPFGRALKAMRENEIAAEAVGKNVVAMKVLVFAVSAALAALAGGLLAHYLTIVGVESFTIETTIYVLAMIILGGTGNLRGSLLGAAILVVLPEALKFIHLPPDIADKLRQVMYGLILIIILRLRPGGILPETGTAGHHVTTALAAAASTASVLPPLATRRGRGDVTLAGRGLAKNFGGIFAVNNVDIELQAGRITGIIGPNGAGKTTAFNLLTGFLPPTGGTVALAGKSLDGLPSHDIVRAGAARSFQDLKLFTKMTVLDNVLVSLPDQSGDRLRGVFFAPWRVRQEEATNIARALAVLDFVGLKDKAEESADNLSYAEEKLLSVARLLATGAEVL
ncbi:MAG: ATP-binding cassette domain-containing protein, partial [Alphaproteobacteria bacterium]|nr:ATP-binding cassette domain-containing protein [Alphaproteobacteria bacterium]